MPAALPANTGSLGFDDPLGVEWLSALPAQAAAGALGAGSSISPGEAVPTGVVAAATGSCEAGGAGDGWSDV